MGRVPIDKDITTEIIPDFKTLVVGDHLAINTGFLGGRHFRHGILTSKDPYTVVDFSGQSISDARIRANDLSVFMNNKTLYRVNHTHRLPGEETARIAVSFVHNNNNNAWGKYNVFTNNCLHFVNYCVTGKKTYEHISSLVYANSRQLIKDVVGTGMDQE